MTNYDNNMKGVLFKNEDKEGSQPDYRGQGEIDRKPVWISAWIKTPKKGGAKFMSLSFQFKTAQQGGVRNPPPADDEPF